MRKFFLVRTTEGLFLILLLLLIYKEQGQIWKAYNVFSRNAAFQKWKTDYSQNSDLIFKNKDGSIYIYRERGLIIRNVPKLPKILWEASRDFPKYMYLYYPGVALKSHGKEHVKIYFLSQGCKKYENISGTHDWSALYFRGGDIIVRGETTSVDVTLYEPTIRHELFHYYAFYYRVNRFLHNKNGEHDTEWDAYNFQSFPITRRFWVKRERIKD